MTAKDFQLIAQTILNMTDLAPRNDANPEQRHKESEATRALVAHQFADALATTNPRFNRALFVQAATGVVPVNARKAK